MSLLWIVRRASKTEIIGGHSPLFFSGEVMTPKDVKNMEDKDWYPGWKRIWNGDTEEEAIEEET